MQKIEKATLKKKGDIEKKKTTFKNITPYVHTYIIFPSGVFIVDIVNFYLKY
jgi:hypothetical protein